MASMKIKKRIVDPITFQEYVGVEFLPRGLEDTIMDDQISESMYFAAPTTNRGIVRHSRPSTETQHPHEEALSPQSSLQKSKMPSSPVSTTSDKSTVKPCTNIFRPPSSPTDDSSSSSSSSISNISETSAVKPYTKIFRPPSSPSSSNDSDDDSNNSYDSPMVEVKPYANIFRPPSSSSSSGSSSSGSDSDSNDEKEAEQEKRSSSPIQSNGSKTTSFRFSLRKIASESHIDTSDLWRPPTPPKHRGENEEDPNAPRSEIVNSTTGIHNHHSISPTQRRRRSLQERSNSLKSLNSVLISPKDNPNLKTMGSPINASSPTSTSPNKIGGIDYKSPGSGGIGYKSPGSGGIGYKSPGSRGIGHRSPGSAGRNKGKLGNFLKEIEENLEMDMDIGMNNEDSMSNLSRELETSICVQNIMVKTVRFEDEVRLFEISKAHLSMMDDLFYASDELANFRYEAFMEEAGLDPNDFD